MLIFKYNYVPSFKTKDIKVTKDKKNQRGVWGT